MTASITKKDLLHIIAQAEQAYPEECCGLLLGNNDDKEFQVTGALVLKNVSAEPEKGFEFDPREQLAAYRSAQAVDVEVIGHYHSHPNARCGPSPTDLKIARERFDNGLWLILAIDKGKFIDASLWQLQGQPGQFIRVELLTIDSESY